MRYFTINKPYGYLSQFTSEGGHPTLGDLFDFPANVYPVGRLDRDSEGLLVLTDDTRLNNALLNPERKHVREYYAQVEGAPSTADIEAFTCPMQLKAKGKFFTSAPAKGKLLPDFEIADRTPPIRDRKNKPTSWLSLELTEGKNRQVRKMTAAVGFPTLRLLRYAIEDLTLDVHGNAIVREWDAKSLFRLLHLSL